MRFLRGVFRIGTGSAVWVSSLFDFHSTHVDSRKIGCPETALLSQQKVIIAEIEWFGAAHRSRVGVTHNSGANSIRRYGIQASHNDSRRSKLELLFSPAPWPFASLHGSDAVDDRQVDRPGTANINDGSRYAPGRVGRGDPIFQAGQLDFLEAFRIMDGAAAGSSVLITSFIAV